MRKKLHLTVSMRIAIVLLIIAFLLMFGGFATQTIYSYGGGGTVSPHSYLSNIVNLRRGQNLNIDFQANGEMNFYIMNKQQYETWKNNGQWEAFVTRKNVAQYQVIFSAPATDLYVMLIDNTFSSFPKSINNAERFVSGYDYEMLATGILLLFASAVIFVISLLHKSTVKRKIGHTNNFSKLLPSKFNKHTSRLWILLRREIRFITSFPILELLVFISTYIFIQSVGYFFGSAGGSIASIETILTRAVVETLFDTNLEIYFMLFMIIVAVLIPYSMTTERDSGVTLSFLSHPLKRHEMFLAKFLAVFLIVSGFMFFSSALFAFTISVRYRMMLPVSIYIIMAICVFLLSVIYSSISSLFSVLTDSTVAASLGSFFIFLLWRFTPDIRQNQIQIPGYSYQVKAIGSYLLLEWMNIRQTRLPLQTISFTEALIDLTSLLTIAAATLIVALTVFNRKDIK